MFKELIP